MTSEIIKSNLFEANVTKKPNGYLQKLEMILVFLDGGSNTQGRKGNFSNSQRIFELILNKNYISPQDIKTNTFNNIVEAAISSAIMQCLWDIEGKLKKNQLVQCLVKIMKK